MRYSSDFISEASGVWESVLLNMVKWPQNFNIQFVPALLPDQTILMSKLAQQFAAKTMVSAAKTLADLDSMRPIDLLFFGSSNAHRDEVHESFRQAAAQHNLRIAFFMDYDFFGAERELAIQQAKVVLNLANFRWPYISHDRPNRSAILSDNFEAAETCAAATNFHRVRSLLAHGKVVLSERSGSTLEESLLSGVVVFADTTALVEMALSLLLDPALRCRVEREAVSYMLQDHTQGTFQTTDTDAGRAHGNSNDSRSSTLALLAQALSDLAGKEKAMQTLISCFYNHVLKNQCLCYLLPHFSKKLAIYYQ
jgi:hypothetical protein